MMFGTRMLLIYPAVVFNADVPHLGPRVGGEGNPHVKSKIFLQRGVLVQLCPLLVLLIVVTCAFEGRAMDAGLSDRLRNKRDSSALDEHLLHAVRTVTTKSGKQPWERGDILSPRPLFAAPYPCVGRPQIAVQTASSSARLEMAKPLAASVAARVIGKLPDTKGPTWEEKLTDHRKAAVAKSSGKLCSSHTAITLRPAEESKPMPRQV